MNDIFKFIEHMSNAASLHKPSGEILYANSIFHKLFNTSDEIINKKLSSEIINRKVLSDFDVFNFINNNSTDDINNIGNFNFKIEINSGVKVIQLDTISIKNGKVYNILIYEDVTDKIRQTDLYRELFNNIKKGVILVGTKDGKNFYIKDINPFAIKTDFNNKEKIINTNLTDINCLNPKIFDAINDVWETNKKSEFYDLDCSMHDKPCWRNVYIYKVSMGDIVILYEDVTDIIETKRKLEKANQIKNKFISNLSHEIKTPINSIVGFSDLLTECNKNNLEYIKYIQTNTMILKQLVEDILDLTKIESGKLNISPNTFNVNNIIDELIKTNKNKLKNNVKLKPNNTLTKLKLFNDEFRFRQVFNNLISNSIKFTKKGYIEIGYKKDDNNIVFYVKDTGIGIKKEYFNKVFERFEQLKSTDQKIGHGLGLSISNELVKLMGGKLWFESEYNKGTTFYFSLPHTKNIKKIEEKEKKINTDISSYDFNGKTILIVEDIEFNTKLLLTYLEDTNVSIISSVDGNDALLKYNENSNNIDLILMDLHLPDITGYEVTKIIRSVNQKIPIVAQTAYSMNSEFSNILENGFNDIIKKPITKDNLLEVINKYI